jgi:hypothetical protein
LFNHQKEKNSILSNNWWGELDQPRNNLWGLSVHTTQTQASQMSCKKERRAREPPVRNVNWTKWSWREVYSTIGMSIHECTNAQREPKVPQEMNKWWADSASPQPETQKWAAVDKILLLNCQCNFNLLLNNDLFFLRECTHTFFTSMYT